VGVKIKVENVVDAMPSLRVFAMTLLCSRRQDLYAHSELLRLS
ncbi:MAG: hypothetical protein ACI9MU_004429, partial [Alphaproteobacteria bacterium]